MYRLRRGTSEDFDGEYSCNRLCSYSRPGLSGPPAGGGQCYYNHPKGGSAFRERSARKIFGKKTSQALKNRDFSKKNPVWVGAKINIPPTKGEGVEPHLVGGGEESALIAMEGVDRFVEKYGLG